MEFHSMFSYLTVLLCTLSVFKWLIATEGMLQLIASLTE